MNPILARIGLLETRGAAKLLRKTNRGHDLIPGSFRTTNRNYAGNAGLNAGDFGLDLDGSHRRDHESAVGKAAPTQRGWGLDHKAPDAFDTHAEFTDSQLGWSLTSQDVFWERSARDDEAAEPSHATSPVDPVAMPADPLLDFNYVTSLPKALLARDPDLIARCLFAAQQTRDLDFIRAISDEQFTSILELLRPETVLGRRASIHLAISPVLAIQLGLTETSQIAKSYAWILQNIVDVRTAAGAKLNSHHYLLLLKAAQALGNKVYAENLWRRMHQDGIRPDTKMYNAYMSAVVWAGRLDALAKHRERVTPFNAAARRTNWLGLGFNNYRFGAKGVREEANSILKTMLRHGCFADQETFRMLITGVAREGEMDVVKSVLRNVWGIEVDALLAGQPEADLQPKALSATDPLFPKSSLLFTLAHAFGINNDLPAALRIVDFVARTYKLNISFETWHTLFEWCFVLASKRSGTTRRNGDTVGQLPIQSVMSLWNTMTSAPYHVVPTMEMYNKLIKNLYSRQMSVLMVNFMSEGCAMHTENVKESRRCRRKLEGAVKEVEDGIDPSTPVSLRLQYYEEAELMRARGHAWVRRWLALLVRGTGSNNRMPSGPEFTLSVLPRLLWEWRAFAPQTLVCDLPTGTVEFQMHSDEEILESAERKRGRAMRDEELISRANVFVGKEWARQSKVLTKRLLNADGGLSNKQHAGEKSPEGVQSHE